MTGFRLEAGIRTLRERHTIDRRIASERIDQPVDQEGRSRAIELRQLGRLIRRGIAPRAAVVSRWDATSRPTWPVVLCS